MGAQTRPSGFKDKLSTRNTKVNRAAEGSATPKSSCLTPYELKAKTNDYFSFSIKLWIISPIDRICLQNVKKK